MIRRNQELFILAFSFISSLILIFLGWFLESWMMVVFGFLMGFRVRSIQQQYQLRKELRNEEVNYVITYKALSNKDFHTIKNVLLENSPSLNQIMHSLPSEETDHIMASQVNSILVSPIERDASFLFKCLILLLWIIALTIPFVLILFFNDLIKENYEWYFQVLSNK
jgi:hypothetical protein